MGFEFNACCPQDFDDAIEQIEWVDLGLPSGTLWRSFNESAPDGSPFMETGCALGTGRDFPDWDDYRELKENCDLEWADAGETQGAVFASKANGNCLFFPAVGEKGTKHVRNVGQTAVMGLPDNPGAVVEIHELRPIPFRGKRLTGMLRCWTRKRYKAFRAVRRR